MILYYAILILHYYYSTNIQEQIIPQNFLWKFLRWMDEIFFGRSCAGSYKIGVIN